MWGMQKCLKSFRRNVLLSLLLQSALSEEVSGQYFPVRRRQNTVKFTENESTWILQLKRRVDENLQCRRWANLNNGFRVAAALKTDHCWPDFVICIDDSISIIPHLKDCWDKLWWDKLSRDKLSWDKLSWCKLSWDKLSRDKLSWDKYCCRTNCCDTNCCETKCRETKCHDANCREANFCATNCLETNCCGINCRETT